MPKPRNRAAQEATLINLRAIKKRMSAIEHDKKALWKVVRSMLRRLNRLELK